MEQLKLHRSMLTLTYRCTLNCYLCSAYVPLYKQKPHFTYDQLESYIRRYFDLVDNVDIFTLTGGEPMLHDDLDRVIRLLDTYYNKIGKICLITNGTILPSQRVIDEIKKYRGCIYVLLDDYGDISFNSDQVESKLKEHGILYERRKYYGENMYFDGWVDNWDLTQKYFTEEDIQRNYSTCSIPNNDNLCMVIKAGIIYPCGPAFRCITEKIVVDPEEKEHINMMDPGLNKAEFKRRIEEMYNATRFQSCAFCWGVSASTTRHKPAQQLPADFNG